MTLPLPATSELPVSPQGRMGLTSLYPIHDGMLDPFVCFLILAVTFYVRDHTEQNDEQFRLFFFSQRGISWGARGILLIVSLVGHIPGGRKVTHLGRRDVEQCAPRSDGRYLSCSSTESQAALRSLQPVS